MEATLVGDSHLLAIFDLLVGFVVTLEVEKKIEFDLDVLGNRRLLDLKSVMPSAHHMDGALIDMDFDPFWVRMGMGRVVLDAYIGCLHVILHCAIDDRLLESNRPPLLHNRRSIARSQLGGMMRGDFDAEAFYAAIDSQREAKGMNWKEVAAETGVSASTLTRMAQGKRPDVDGLAALLAWSGLQAEDFIRTGNRKRQPEALAQITAVLRADRNLSRESAEAIEQILRAAYKRFRE
jgi:transcriptional regulator with XRE-family HTH domain